VHFGGMVFTKKQIRKIKKDRLVQKQFYEQCFSILMPVCLRYFKERNDAESMLNEGFMKIFNNIEKYNIQTPFDPWAKRVMINLIIDNHRKNLKHKQNTVYNGDDYLNRNEKIYVELNDGEEKMIYDELYNLIHRLPETTSKVFNLYVIDGFKHKEIAELLGISEGTSKWHLSSARRKLQQLIQQITKTEQVFS
jgi:RNA polymerase sigma factor (sigma-70 family)